MATPSAGIRLAAEDDAAAVAAIYAPIVTQTAISFETEPPDERQMRERIAGILATYPWLVHVHDGRITGYAYASRHRARAAYAWSVDTAVHVDVAYRRRGIARALYRSLFAILEAQGVASAFAGVALPNPASIALHEQAGFVSVGIYRNVGYKLGAWRDVAWFQRPVGPHRIPPPAVTSVQDVRHRVGWPDLLRRGEAT